MNLPKYRDWYQQTDVHKPIRQYQWGEDPDFYGPRNYHREGRMLRELRRTIKSGCVLDAGCGNGWLTLRLVANNYNVVGIDSSPQCITHLRNKIKALHYYRKIYTYIGDLAKLSFRDNSFDGIVCGEVLEHIQDDTKVILEFFRVLRPGGICVVTVPAKPDKWDIVDDISGHKRRYTRKELEIKFRQAGFKIVKNIYWGFPLNNIWHSYIFLPFIVGTLKNGFNTSISSTLVARIIKQRMVQKVGSLVFTLDEIFDWTGLGNFLLLVATKDKIRKTHRNRYQ